MNWDIFAGNLKQLEGKLKVRWGRFNDTPFDVIDGKRMVSAGIIQASSGTAWDKTRQKERKSA